MPLVYDPFLSLAEVRGMRLLRRHVVGAARGRVLELGAGTGLNVRYYGTVERLVLTEPEAGMAKHLRRRVSARGVKAEVVEARAELLPFGDGEFDAVVGTLVLCTIADPVAALSEVRRVLAPDGRFLFVEHVRGGAGTWLERWQDRLFAPWRAFAYGCRCNQDTVGLLRSSGFELVSVADATWRGMPALVAPLVYGEARAV